MHSGIKQEEASAQGVWSPPRVALRWSRALIVIACTGTLFSVLAPCFWLFEIGSHFVNIYGLLALTGGLGTLVLRKWGWSAAALPALAYSLAVVAPWYVPQAAASPGGDSFRVMLSNVLVYSVQYDMVIEAVREADPDFFVGQELSQEWYQQLQQLRDAYPYVVGPEQGAQGVALFSKHPVTRYETGMNVTSTLRTVMAEVDFGGRPLTIYAMHADPPFTREKVLRRNQQLDELADAVLDSETPVVVIGDLNITIFSPVYKQFEQKAKLTNTRQGRGLHGTWPAPLGYVTIPIDHVLFSKGLQSNAFRAGPFVGSDHYPVIASLVYESQPEAGAAAQGS